MDRKNDRSACVQSHTNGFYLHVTSSLDKSSSAIQTDRNKSKALFWSSSLVPDVCTNTTAQPMCTRRSMEAIHDVDTIRKAHSHGTKKAVHKFRTSTRILLFTTAGSKMNYLSRYHPSGKLFLHKNK
jgi:hypothetical protein